jgi:hypothetical protein
VLKPFLVEDSAAYDAAKRSPKGVPGSTISNQSTAPRTATVSSPYAASFVGLADQSNPIFVEPPDTQLAAGPSTLVEMVNDVGQIYTKKGAPIGSPFLLKDFFLMPSGTTPTDPRILYDATVGRWYASMLAFNLLTNSSAIFLAISTSSDPTAVWYIYQVYGSPSLICDQPKLGYSSDKFVIGCSNFDSAAHFTGGVIIVASKTQGLAGAAMNIGQTAQSASRFGLLPTQNMSAGAPAFVVFNQSPAAVAAAGLITITGDPAAGLGGVSISATVSVPIAASTTVPPNASQSGSTATIASGDDRFMSAVVQGGQLWTSGATGCTPAGDVAVRSCMQLVEINLSGPTMTQDPVVGTVGKYVLFPTLGLDANNDAVISYTLSSSSDFPSVASMVQVAGQSAFTALGVLQAGAEAYMGSRWGDYSAVAVDPAAPTNVWLAGELSSVPLWGTWIGEISPSVALSPTGIGFGQQIVSTTSAPQPLTVTNNGPLSVHVTAALNSGSTDQFHVVDNACASATLAPLANCAAHFTFNPTTTGDKEARFNVAGLSSGPLALVLTGIGIGAACASTAISTDKMSPQNVGTIVTLMATSSGCPDPSPLYKFLIRDTSGTWKTVRDFSTTASYAWDTSTWGQGTFLIGVWVRDVQSTNSYDAYAFGTFTLALPSCSSVNIASDVASPQVVATTVNFTASSVGCPSPLYQWFVRDTAGNWTIVPGHDFAHSSTTLAWNTSTLTEGTYQVGVWVKQIGSLASYDAFAFVTYTLTVGGGHCAVPQLAPGVSSPQAAGSSILFTASSTGCTSPLYRFYIRDLAGTWHVVQDFSPTTTYNWTPASPVSTNTAGTYLVGIWAKAVGSTNTYDDFYFLTYTLTSGTPCTVNIAAVPGTGATAGTPVTWTATALNCTAGSKYRFWVNPPGGSFGIVQDYTTTNTYHWTQSVPGTNQVGVWVLQPGSTAAYDAFAFTTFTLKPTSTPQVCGSVGVASDVASPQNLGAVVHFTATANGCSSPQYQWWLRDTSANWAIVQDFAHSNSAFTWNTFGLMPGTYLLGVWARQTGSTASYEAYSFITYTVVVPAGGGPCTSVGISPSVASPQNAGTTVTFTATALGCGSPDYRFFIAPPGGTFAQVQPFGSPNTFVWNTAGLAPGPYQVGVWARQHFSTATYEAFAFITFQIQQAGSPCTTLVLSLDLGQLVARGSIVTFTAVAAGCPAPQYQFYLRSPGSSSFVNVRAYSASGAFVLSTASSSLGGYTLLVLAKDASSPGSLDTYAETDFQII